MTMNSLCRSIETPTYLPKRHNKRGTNVLITKILNDFSNESVIDATIKAKLSYDWAYEKAVANPTKTYVVDGESADQKVFLLYKGSKRLKIPQKYKYCMEDYTDFFATTTCPICAEFSSLVCCESCKQQLCRECLTKSHECGYGCPFCRTNQDLKKVVIDAQMNFEQTAQIHYESIAEYVETHVYANSIKSELDWILIDALLRKFSRSYASEPFPIQYLLDEMLSAITTFYNEERTEFLIKLNEDDKEAFREIFHRL